MLSFSKAQFNDKIASACIDKFNSLGKNGKPKQSEWTLIAGVVKEEIIEDESKLCVVSLGSGSKCIGKSLMPANGNVLHDSHAEVIAKRAFQLYIYEQINHVFNEKYSIFEKGEFPLNLKKNIYFHFYSSHLPCGDASIFPKYLDNVGNSEITQSCMNDGESDIDDCGNVLLNSYKRKCEKVSENLSANGDLTDLNSISKIASKKFCVDNSTPKCEIKSVLISEVTEETSSRKADDLYRTGAKSVNGELGDSMKPGLAYHSIGILRTKPGRGDPTLSHSCSDKIFKWLILGIQGSLLLMFINRPIYLKSLIIGFCPFDRYSFERGIWGRFSEKLKLISLPPPFLIKPPIIGQSSINFPFSKSVVEKSINDCTPSVTSIIWSDTSFHSVKHEVSVSGYKLGTNVKSRRLFNNNLSITRARFMNEVLLLFSKHQKHFNFIQNLMHKEGIISKYDFFKFYQFTYKDLKDLSISYKEAWLELRRNVVKNWTQKPIEIKSFRLENKK